jgi:hypothetical protein
LYGKSLFLFSSALLIDEKSAKVMHKAFSKQIGNFKPSSKHKMYDFRIFWTPVLEKEGGLSTYKPSSEEEGDKRRFCIKRLRILN